MSDKAISELPAGADKLAYAREDGPDIGLLQTEYDNCWQQGDDSRRSGWSLSLAEDVRYNRWRGQSWDGLRHAENMGGKDCRPYENAPDVRISLVDETIEAVVDILFAAFFAARVNPRPVHASRMNSQEAAEWRAVVNWMKNGPLARDLINQVEFLAQSAHTFGWSVLHPTWERTHCMQPQHLTMDNVMMFAQRAPAGSIARQLPAMILGSGAKGTARTEADKANDEALVQIFTGMFDGLKDKDAKQLIQDLRENGEAEFNLPVEASNGPRLHVLIPNLDFICPTEMTDPQRARVLFRRFLYTTAEVEAMVEDDDWDPEFVAAVMSTAGTGSEFTTTAEQQNDDNARLIEIVVAFAMQTVDGVPGIFCTIFSPNMRNRGNGTYTTDRTDRKDKDGAPVEPKKLVETDGPLYAKHFLLDMAHREQPFMVYQTEVIGKRPDDSRGIPEKLAIPQREMKRYRDALGMRAELETTPPLTKTGARASKVPPEFGPLGVFNQTKDGEWKWFAPPTGNPTLAFQLFETIKQERDEQHGLPSAKVHPTRWQARQRKQIMRWLQTWGHTLWQLSVLAYVNLSQDELTEIIGHPPMLTSDKIMKFTLAMEFDVRTLDPDWAKEMIQQIAEILQVDTGGTIDRSKLVGLMLSYLDSTLADEVTTDQQGAAKKVFDDVRNEVSLIMQGNEGDYVENDPTAKMKLQFLQKILAGNPDYIMKVHQGSKQFNPRKAQLLQKYAASLQQSAVQQDNKLVGRIGVKPEAMEKQPARG